MNSTGSAEWAQFIQRGARMSGPNFMAAYELADVSLRATNVNLVFVLEEEEYWDHLRQLETSGFTWETWIFVHHFMAIHPMKSGSKEEDHLTDIAMTASDRTRSETFLWDSVADGDIQAKRMDEIISIHGPSHRRGNNGSLWKTCSEIPKQALFPSKLSPISCELIIALPGENGFT